MLMMSLMLMMVMLLVVFIVVVDAHRQNTSLHAQRIGFKWTALSHLRRSLVGEKPFNVDVDNQPISGGILLFFRWNSVTILLVRLASYLLTPKKFPIVPQAKYLFDICFCYS